MRIAPFVAVCLLTACRQDNSEIHRELAQIHQELQALRAQLARGGTAQAQRPPGPDPSKVYAVDVAGAPAVGPASAPVTVVIAYEYACPWCNKERQAFEQVRQAYGDDVRFVFRPFVVHPDLAGDASLAACAADRQGHFAEVSDALWTNVFEKRAFDRASVENAAGSVQGVDLARLRTDMDGDCKPWVERERAALSDLGVNGTPQVWVNGRPVVGGYKPLEGLKPLIDEELARARERIAAGTPRDAYYTEWVVKKGLRKLEVASK
jgi:protein-disulfide isomerase